MDGEITYSIVISNDGPYEAVDPAAAEEFDIKLRALASRYLGPTAIVTRESLETGLDGSPNEILLDEALQARLDQPIDQLWSPERLESSTSRERARFTAAITPLKQLGIKTIRQIYLAGGRVLTWADNFGQGRLAELTQWLGELLPDMPLLAPTSTPEYAATFCVGLHQIRLSDLLGLSTNKWSFANETQAIAWPAYENMTLADFKARHMLPGSRQSKDRHAAQIADYIVRFEAERKRLRDTAAQNQPGTI